jgi:hypothetical protein
MIPNKKLKEIYTQALKDGRTKEIDNFEDGKAYYQTFLPLNINTPELLKYTFCWKKEHEADFILIGEERLLEI